MRILPNILVNWDDSFPKPPTSYPKWLVQKTHVIWGYPHFRKPPYRYYSNVENRDHFVAESHNKLSHRPSILSPTTSGYVQEHAKTSKPAGK